MHSANGRRASPKIDSPFDLFIVLTLVALVATTLMVLLPGYRPLRITVEARGQLDRFEVSVRPSFDAPFDPTFSAADELRATSRTLSFVLPPEKPGILRFEPATQPGEVRISSICVAAAGSPAENLCFRGGSLLESFIARDHIDRFALEGNELVLSSIGTNPFFESDPALAERLVPLARKRAWPLRLVGMLLVLALIVVTGKIRTDLSSSRTRVLGAVGLVLVFAVCVRSIASLAPPFQGADEQDHLGRFLSYELGLPCGTIPTELRAVWELFATLPHHPERRVKEIPELRAAISSTTEEIENGTCRYGRAGLVLPGFIDRLSPLGRPVGEWIAAAREAFFLTAVAWFAVPLLLVAAGKPLSGREGPGIRGSVALACLVFLFLPQVLWMSGVVNEDPPLIAASLILGVSVFFRVPFLSDGAIAVSLLAASSKLVYLPLFTLLAVVHYVRVAGDRVPRLFSSRASAATFFFGASSVAFVLGRMALRAYCRENYCYGIERSGMMGSWRDLFSDLRTMFVRFDAFRPPPRIFTESAFGSFGWLDTPLASHFGLAYSLPLTWAMLALAVLGLGTLLRRNRSRSPGEGFSIGALAGLWIIGAVATLYVVFTAMQVWCGPSSTMGCGYQRRYELPLLTFPVLAVFVGVFFGVRAELRRAALVTLLACQIGAGVFALLETQRILSARYFDGEL